MICPQAQHALLSFAFVAVTSNAFVIQLIAVTMNLCPVVLFLFFDGYCSSAQGLLDWFEVDIGFSKLCLLRLICVLCVCIFTSYTLLSPFFLCVLQCPPRAAGVPLESALNLVSCMCPCGARATNCGMIGVKITCYVFEKIELMIRVFIEVRITYSSQDNQVPAVQLYLLYISHLFLPSKHNVA